jgi:hypothetical protein
MPVRIWTRDKYRSIKASFIDRYADLSYFSLALVLGLVAGAAWACSHFMLSKWQMTSMPVRYLVSGSVAYLVFVVLIRIWADWIQEESQYYSVRRNVTEGAAWEAVPEAMGSWIVVSGLMLVLVLVMALFGGVAVLLEVAFEVAFAGVIVEHAARINVVGSWFRLLLRKTMWRAVLMTVLWALLGAYLQYKVPSAVTLSQALNRLI